MAKTKGKIFIISAPSGCGKTTLVSMLLTGLKGLKRSVSATTRRPRKNEKNNRDYIFINKKDFESRIKKGLFLEWAIVFGQYYGTPRQPIEEWTAKGLDTVLSIDVQGARKVKKKVPQAISIFIMPPSMKELKKRLSQRKTDTKAQIDRRLDTAKKEMADARRYDYKVVNDKLDKAAARLEAIIAIERHKKEVDRCLTRCRKK